MDMQETARVLAEKSASKIRAENKLFYDLNAVLRAAFIDHLGRDPIPAGGDICDMESSDSHLWFAARWLTIDLINIQTIADETAAAIRASRSDDIDAALRETFLDVMRRDPIPYGSDIRAISASDAAIWFPARKLTIETLLQQDFDAWVAEHYPHAEPMCAEAIMAGIAEALEGQTDPHAIAELHRNYDWLARFCVRWNEELS